MVRISIDPILGEESLWGMNGKEGAWCICGVCLFVVGVCVCVCVCVRVCVCVCVMCVTGVSGLAHLDVEHFVCMCWTHSARCENKLVNFVQSRCLSSLKVRLALPINFSREEIPFENWPKKDTKCKILRNRSVKGDSFT